ncbi:MAG: tellurite resistance TerB family protein [Elusimicrobiales bacterium]
MKKNKCACCSSVGKINKIKAVEDAVMALCVLAISSDGEVNSKEMDSLYKILSVSPIFKNSKKTKEDYINCVLSSIAHRTRGEVISECVKTIPQKLRATAYAWIYFALKSDKEVIHPEHKFLDEITKHFKLPGALAGKIKAVVEIISRDK